MVLERTRGRTETPAHYLTQDSAFVEVLLDPAAPPGARATACRRLRLALVLRRLHRAPWW